MLNGPQLSVATYNIHRCVGRDGRFDPARIVHVLREIDCDIVGLQEVESRFSGALHAHQSEFLTAATGMHCVTGPTISGSDSHYGNMLLSRWIPKAVRRIDLSYSGDPEPRGALDVDLDVDGARLRFLVTHLGLSAREREWQIQRLVGNLPDSSADAVVLLGDLNEWWPCAPAFHRLRRYFDTQHARRTFPAGWPALALDQIWLRRARAIEEVRAHRSALSRVASDHLPLVAGIRL